jgi:PAS domain S-box-containing protein
MSRASLTDSLRETLALFELVDAGEPLTTTEVADRLDLGRRATYGRLERLVDRDRLETKKVGAKGRIWWVPSAQTGPGDLEDLHARLVEFAPMTVYRRPLDPTAAMERVGDAVADLTGYSPETLTTGEVTWHEVVAPDDRAGLPVGVDDRTDDQFAVEYRVDTASGETRWLRDRGYVVDTPPDHRPLVEGLLTDVTEEKRSERALAESEQQFRSLVDETEEYAIFMLDADGHVQTWNEGAKRIKGYEREEILGEHFSTFYTDESRAEGVPEANLEAAAADDGIRDEGWRVRADGTQFLANITLTPIWDDDGDLDGYAKVTQDVTERRERERKHRQERAFVESLFDSQRDLFYAFDTSGEPLRWNDRFEEVTGYDAADIESLGPLEFVSEDATAEVHAAIERVVETGESVTVELPLVTADGTEIPYEFTGAPIRDEDDEVVGVTGVGRDVTERKRTERELERQRDDLLTELSELFGRIDDAVVGLDESWHCTHASEQAAAVFDRSVGELLGRPVLEELPDDVAATFRTQFERAQDTQEVGTFETFHPVFDTWFEVRVYPSETGLSVYMRDVTDRKTREAELERYERMVETVDDGIYLLDDDHEFTMVNSAFASMVGYDREELLGSHAERVFGEQYVEIADRKQAELATGDEQVAVLEEELHPADGDPFFVESRFTLFGFEDGTSGRIGTVRDVTERKARKRQLERYERIVETVDDGIYAVDEDARFVLVNEAFCELTGYDEDELLGAEATLIHDPEVTTRAESLAADVETADATAGSLEVDVYTKSGGSLPCESHIAPFPMGGSTGRCGVVRDISERLDREQTLLRQRERLEALNSMNDVVREITDAVIEQSTREEIEATVCELLADSESYRFAWVGDVDVDSQTVDLRTEAGVDGYLDGITISVDPGDERSGGPTGRALRTGELQTTQYAGSDAAHDPWRDHVETYRFRSSAAIPIVNEGTVYGVLNVYTDRAGAFEGQERTVVRQLGEVVGHAIAAAERKEALMGDDVTEIGFQLPNLFRDLDIPAVDGRITIDQTVPIGDDEFLVYGTATDDAPRRLDDLVTALDHWEDLTAIDRSSERLQFQLRLTEPPVLTRIASRGGYVDRAIIEDGDYRMTIHLPRSVDPRAVVAEVEDAYPNIELLSRRQRSRSSESIEGVSHVLEELTERQLAVLETAHHSGFFEWPRHSSGDDVASSLGISPPTFHQHLRKGQKHVFDALFAAPNRVDPS